MRLGVVIISTAALAGCQSLAQQHDYTCKSYGTEPGSAAYVNCRMGLDAQFANNMNQALLATAQALQPPATVNVYSSPPSPLGRQVNCTSTRSGVTVSTTCN